MGKHTDSERHIAFNTHLLLCLILFPIFLGISITLAVRNEIGWSVIFAIFTCVPVVAFFLSPFFFIFTDEAVEIVYHFGQRERITWNSVRNIYVMGSWFAHSAPPHYVFVYPQKEKRLFFVVGEIPKTRKTKKLITRYYKKSID